MTEKQDPIVAILVKYALRQPLSDEELRRLGEWRSRSDVHEELPDLLQDPQWRDEHQREMASAPSGPMWENIRDHIQASRKQEAARVTRRAWRVRRWGVAAAGAWRVRRWGVAAAGLALLMGAGWWFGTRRSGVAVAVVQRALFMPAGGEGSDDVLLMLGDGRTLRPAKARVGEQIAVDGKWAITRDANGIVYTKLSGEPERGAGKDFLGDAQGKGSGTQSIYVGRGVTGGFQVRFPDGSKVLLDTHTRLAYAVSLRTGPEPVVEGQAFFAIAHNDAAHPLRIWTGKGESLTVLGTSFNVRSRPGEGSEMVELYSGKLRVDRKAESLLLEADRRVVLTEEQGLVAETMGPHEEIPAWARPPAKSPYFEFQATPLPVALQAVAGWYGKTVYNPGNIKGVPVTGKLPRNVSLEHTLRALQQVQGRNAVLRSRADTIYVSVWTPGS
jgi:hypothetical protein